MKQNLKDLHIEHQPIRTLHPASRNPRTHTKKQIQQSTKAFAMPPRWGLVDGTLLIIDDPAKPMEALSKVKRDFLKQWYDGTLYSRLDNKAENAIILVMQRVHVDDLVAHVKDKEHWGHLNLRPSRNSTRNLLSGMGGSLLADRVGNRYYLLDVLRLRLDYPDLRRRVVAHRGEFFAQAILIEESASGFALIQDIREMAIDNFTRPIAVKPQGDTVMRLSRHSATIEADHVDLPRQASWLEAFKAEFLAFPEGRHDDQVNSVSQFLPWLVERRLHYIDSGYF